MLPWGDPAPYSAPLAAIEVERNQARLALLHGGITRMVIEQTIAEILDAIKRETTDIRYQQPRWSSDSEFIARGRGAFDLTEQRARTSSRWPRRNNDDVFE